MKINRLGWIAALALTGIVATAPLATAAEGDRRPNREGRERGQRGPRGNAEDRIKRMTAALELSEAQQKQVKAIFAAQNKEMQKLREVPREERREKFGKLRESFDTKFKAVLNDDQKKKYAKLQTEQRGRRRGAGAAGGDRPQRNRPERPQQDK